MPEHDSVHGGLQAEISILKPENSKLCGTILEVSAEGMALATAEPVSIGSLVKVEWLDHLVLGEVRYSHLMGTGYRIGIEVEHALEQTRQLARLSEQLLCLSEPETRDSVVHGGKQDRQQRDV